MVICYLKELRTVVVDLYIGAVVVVGLDAKSEAVVVVEDTVGATCVIISEYTSHLVDVVAVAGEFGQVCTKHTNIQIEFARVVVD